MTSNRQSDQGRLRELLADRALGLLDSESENELRALLERTPDFDCDEFDFLAAEVSAAHLEDSLTAVPEALLARLRRGAEDFSQGKQEVSTSFGDDLDQSSASPTLGVVAWTGWLLAAASAIFALQLQFKTDEQPASLSEERASLIASAEDLVQIDWSPTEDARIAGRAISGDVVWSDDRDEGFMTLKGLPINDPSFEQYQLWIFDKERSADYPVDGGVFDVTSAGEVIVPIDAAIDVDKAFLFAVTVERPGGVVVSDREHLVLLAQL